MQGTVIYFEYKTLGYTQIPLTDLKMRINTYQILQYIFTLYIYIFYQYILTEPIWKLNVHTEDGLKVSRNVCNYTK